MARQLTPRQLIERSITKTYRYRLWGPFLTAIQRYDLIQTGDRIAVCISGGKDSMLLATMMRMLQIHSDIPFEVGFLVMDPGYNEKNRRQIEENAARLELPIHIFETNIFDVANIQEESPCYLCARMRRGALYSKAKELGCNKIALGHHFNDVIETTLMGMFYASQLQGMMPKLHSTNFPGMELIRPLYLVHEDDIIAWRNYNNLTFLRCACRFTEQIEEDDDGVQTSKRQEVKLLLKELKKENPDIEKSIFNSLHAVHIDTFPGFKTKGENHSFLETYTKEDES